LYLLDYKIENKSVREVRDKILLSFIPWLEKEKGRLTKHKTELASNAVGCLVLNVVFRLRFGKKTIAIPRKWSVYSLPLVYNCTKINRSISYTYTMLLCDFLIQHYQCLYNEGYCKFEIDKADYKEQKKKGVESPKAKLLLTDKQSSFFELSDEFLDLFSNVSIKPTEINLSVIEVRDSDGNPISKKLTPKQKQVMEVLSLLNLKYRTNQIMLDGERLDFQIKKIYNESSYKMGGRNYMIGADAGKAMKKDNRLYITINDEPCVELDYKSFMPSVMADLSGVTFSETFDPYRIQMDGYEPELLRDIAKRGLLALMNTDNMKAAQYALSSILSEKEWRDKINKASKRGMWPEGRIVHTIIEKLLERNPYIAEQCNKHSALQYQNIESEITDIVVEMVLQEGYIIIPLHDSFIVPVSAENFTKFAMQKAYELVVGGNNCRITVEMAKA
jgi:hypothetical protein